MADPLDILRAPILATDPAPAFARRLRIQLERALTLPRGVAVSTVTEFPTQAAADSAAPPAIVPYLALADARAAIDWYIDVFGAALTDEPIVMPDGRIGHAELAIGPALIYLSDESPDLGVVAPKPGAAAVSLMLDVADADAVRARALAAGADGRREPYDGYGARHAWIVDPFGHRWGLQSPLPPVRPAAARTGPRHGDIGYVSIWVPDVEVAAQFYADVLGWTYSASHRPDGRLVDGTNDGPSIGIHVSAEAPTLFCCYAVDDVEAAVSTVRAAGGAADNPTEEPFGRVATCTDDQGTQFAIYQPPASPRRFGIHDDTTETDHPTETDDAAGYGDASDLAYLTMGVADSARARAFYGSVLGWTFSPGRAAESDGWAVDGPAPMVGLAGGNTQAANQPMWRVTDIAAAVQRVRRAGGTSTEPTQQPYGRMAECVDNQGSRFYLGQL